MRAAILCLIWTCCLCNLIYLQYFDLYSDILRAAELAIIIIDFIFIHIFSLTINYYIFGNWCTRYQNLSLAIISIGHPWMVSYATAIEKYYERDIERD